MKWSERKYLIYAGKRKFKSKPDTCHCHTYHIITWPITLRCLNSLKVTLKCDSLWRGTTDCCMYAIFDLETHFMFPGVCKYSMFIVNLRMIKMKWWRCRETKCICAIHPHAKNYIILIFPFVLPFLCISVVRWFIPCVFLSWAIIN